MSEATRTIPPATRGRPFQKGNPGKPAGARPRSSILAERLMSADIEAITKGVIDKAKAGDMLAARIVLDRLYPPRKGAPVTFSLPDGDTAVAVARSFGALVQAVAGGVLSPEEGQSVGAILEARRKAIELVDMEERITALEAKAKERR